MPDEKRGTLDRIVEAVGLAFLPLQDVLAIDNLPTLALELGLDKPLPALGSDAAFTQKLADAATQAGTLVADIVALVEAAEADDTTAILKSSAELIEALAKLIADLDAIATDLKRATSGSPDAADIAAFAGVFVERLLEDSIIRYLEVNHPTVAQVLALLTFIEFTPLTVTVNGVDKLIFRRIMHLDRIGPLFNDTLAFLNTAYGWGDETFDAKTLLQRIGWLFDELGPLAGLEDADGTDPVLLDLFALAIVPTADHPPGLEARLAVDVAETTEIVLSQFGPNWRLALELGGALQADLSARLLPPARIEATHPTATIEGDVGLRLIGSSPTTDTPFVLFGETSGSRLQAKEVDVGFLVGLKWDVAQNKANADVAFEAKFANGKIIVDTSKSDSFLAKLMPGDGIQLDFDFDAGWSSQRGFFFSGSAALELAFAINVTIGPLSIDTLHLLLGIGTDKLRIEVSLDAHGSIGPISAAVERIGVEADLAFHRGNLGPVDLGIGFKFPAGLGINIAAGPITGGGFIEFDQPNGRYAGVLALSLYSIQIKAIGLLDTKLPNGESGYSFLVIISVEFTPIQLGFGFTLNGVGGLCGINRDFVTDAIQAGLRAHSLDHILFPKDPVKNAPAIISDLRAIFPPAEGRYVFGPMLELGWGGGLNLVTAEFGVLFALPAPWVIAILGQLNVNVPSPDAAVIELHLDVLGIIDFGKKLFSLDATLHDSRIVIFTIFGDMAMRLSWGDNPSFALSIGGLNPHFQPPDGFPQLKRLTIALSASDEFRLSIQTYFAITSNSFQFGAHAELYIGVSAFNVYGWLGFDALFIFKPFSFVVDFTAGLALRSGTSTLLGISLDGELSGPKPWHAVGNAHVTLLFFEISCHVDITWGESGGAKDLPEVDAWPQLQAAIQNVQNWSGGLPSGVPAPVTLSTPKADDTTIYVDPSGVLTMRERVLPLDQTLTKFGEAVPGPQNQFTLVSNLGDPSQHSVLLGGAPVPFTIVRDKFAPAQFEEMSDQDKLSRPSFEDRDAGFAVGDGQLDFGGVQLGLDVAFEDIYVDDHAPPPAPTFRFNPTLIQQIAWANTNGAARSALRATALGKFAPPATAKPLVAVGAEQYVVASTNDLTQRPDITHPVTKGEAFQALSVHLANNPGDRGQLQVVPLYELAA